MTEAQALRVAPLRGRLERESGAMKVEAYEHGDAVAHCGDCNGLTHVVIDGDPYCESCAYAHLIAVGYCDETDVWDVLNF